MTGEKGIGPRFGTIHAFGMKIASFYMTRPNQEEQGGWNDLQQHKTYTYSAEDFRDVSDIGGRCRSGAVSHRMRLAAGYYRRRQRDRGPWADATGPG